MQTCLKGDILELLLKLPWNMSQMAQEVVPLLYIVFISFEYYKKMIEVTVSL